MGIIEAVIRIIGIAIQPNLKAGIPFRIFIAQITDAEMSTVSVSRGVFKRDRFVKPGSHFLLGLYKMFSICPVRKLIVCFDYYPKSSMS